MSLKNAIKHFSHITGHKSDVFVLCAKCGLVWQGIIHDLSKYSWTEFSEGVKYYNGKRSPNALAKEDYGYSKAWIHHKGRNPHHHEYWYDYDAPDKTPVMPYKHFAVWMIDSVVAGKAYKGKEWTNSYPLEYWERVSPRLMINEKMKAAATEIYTQIKEQGINKTLTRKNLKAIYAKHCR